ncbi:TPA: hypothetical protein L9K64_001375 [Klebsiella variicola]|nr:hypothetical protein [Klebsiella variicola]
MMNLEEFARAMTVAVDTAPKAINGVVKHLADETARIAREEIGTYQESVGPFPAWASLAESTEQDKARNGYPLNSPLERTGEMRDSIKSEEFGDVVFAGSGDEKLYWHENGTPKMPPRPVMGPAAIRATENVETVVSKALKTVFKR